MIKSLNIFSTKYVRTFCSNDPIKYYMKKIKENENEKEKEKIKIKEKEKEKEKEKVKVKEKSNQYLIVVGTFKYKKNADKQLELIKLKYPKTTNDKIAKVALIKNNGKQFYESRFQFFSIKDATKACSRLKKFKRDCFVRG